VLHLTALAASLPAAGPLHALGPSWLSPDHLIQQFGAYAIIVVCIMVFVETGLLFPLLPGDSLLFTAGALVMPSSSSTSRCGCCASWSSSPHSSATRPRTGSAAAWGHDCFKPPRSRIFKQEHIEADERVLRAVRRAHDIIIGARFIPFVADLLRGVGRCGDG